MRYSVYTENNAWQASYSKSLGKNALSWAKITARHVKGSVKDEDTNKIVYDKRKRKKRR